MKGRNPPFSRDLAEQEAIPTVDEVADQNVIETQNQSHLISSQPEEIEIPEDNILIYIREGCAHLRRIYLQKLEEENLDR